MAAEPVVNATAPFAPAIARLPAKAYLTKSSDRFEGVVIVDTPVNPPDRPRRGPPAVRGGKVYPTLEAALARFRLAPPQPCENHYAMDYIARWSLRKAPLADGSGDGWAWKFDPSIWQRFQVSRPPQDLLKATRCRIALFKGDKSVIWEDESCLLEKPIYISAVESPVCLVTIGSFDSVGRVFLT